MREESKLGLLIPADRIEKEYYDHSYGCQVIIISGCGDRYRHSPYSAVELVKIDDLLRDKDHGPFSIGHVLGLVWRDGPPCSISDAHHIRTIMIANGYAGCPCIATRTCQSCNGWGLVPTERVRWVNEKN